MTAIDSTNVVWGTAGLVAVAIIFGISSNSAAASDSKVWKRLLASVLAGSAIFAGTLAMALHEWQRPYELEGIIEQVNIEQVNIKPGSKHGISTEFRLHVAPGESFYLVAGGGSPYFRVGQLVKVKFSGRSVDQAQFLSDDGKEEAKFISDSTVWIYCSPLIGLVIVSAGLIKFLNDPHGKEMGGSTPETQLRIFDTGDSET